MTDGVEATTYFPLGEARRGYSGVIRRIDAGATGSALSAAELESRLIELGFVEGARVEVLHEGAVGRDPIAVRVENVTIAVRRRAVVPGLVHLRPAMRLDAGGDPPRDRKLEVECGHLKSRKQPHAK